MGTLLWFFVIAVAGWLTGPVGALVMVVAWVFFSLLPKRQQAQIAVNEVIHQHASVLEVEEEDADWTFQFADMKASCRSGPPDEVRETDHYTMARDEQGRWTITPTRASAKKEEERLRSLLANGMGEAIDADLKERLAHVVLKKPDPLEGRLATLVETAYQKYVKTPLA